MNTLFGKLEDVAIARLQEYEQIALDVNPDGYYLAYSGGKDSDVILRLAEKSGVKFKAHHSLTTCDPPELVRHVRTKDVEIHRPKMTMWQLIRKKRMPPRRNARYCCEVLKESAGDNAVIITGVRWGESSRRGKRKMFEACFRHKRKWFLHPIIDWSETDVWDYIRTQSIDYCKLYDEGFRRLGCVMCPMKRDIDKEIARWPRIAKAWERAVKATWKNPDSDKDVFLSCQSCGTIAIISTLPKRNSRFQFDSPEEYWQWWLDRDRKAIRKDDNQCMMFED